MRKSAVRESKNLTVNSVQQYHGGNWASDGSYASEGFDGYEAGTMPYFASDRTHTVTFSGEKINPKTGALQAFAPKAYGLEIETGCDGIIGNDAYATVLKNVLFPIFPKGFFKLQRDGSLRGQSQAEMITGLVTKEALRNNYPNFKKMFNEFFPLFNVGADSEHGCGMHINISRALLGNTPESQEETAKKLIYFVNMNYDFCCALFARDREHTTYCGRMFYSDDYEEVCRKFNRLTSDNDHGNCFNVSHWNEGSGRLEIRLPGGQKKFGTFRNTLEVVFFLIPRIIKLQPKDLKDYVKVFSGCNKYVFDRLNTKCKAWSLPGRITEEQLEAIRATVTDEEYF